jgi:DNA repair protein RadC
VCQFHFFHAYEYARKSAEVRERPERRSLPSEADLRPARRILEASKILQLQLVDHVIIGSPAPGRSDYFSFKEGGVIG